jgi:hypothetical protein
MINRRFNDRASCSARNSSKQAFARKPRTNAAPQAIVIDLAQHVVERVPEEMHIAALPRRLRQHLANRHLQPRMVVVGDAKLDAGQTARL